MTGLSFGPTIAIKLDLLLHAEGLGFDSAWTAEAYGSDAVTPATWILAQTEKIKAGTAIMQMPARTPAMAAMTAMSLAELSGGRFICGLGASGPQVVEGWHGVPYGKPVTRTREYIQIVRKIFEIVERISKENGVTILLVEQNANLALNLASRGYVLETGTVTLEDDAKALLANPEIKKAYLGE